MFVVESGNSTASHDWVTGQRTTERATPRLWTIPMTCDKFAGCKPVEDIPGICPKFYQCREGRSDSALLSAPCSDFGGSLIGCSMMLTD